MVMQSQHGLLYCIGAWEAEEGETRQACSKRGEASHLFIVLDKATLFVAAARNARVCETQLCDMGMGTYGGAYRVGHMVGRIVLYV
jgi:hypothetical protein